MADVSRWGCRILPAVFVVLVACDARSPAAPTPVAPAASTAPAKLVTLDVWQQRAETDRISVRLDGRWEVANRITSIRFYEPRPEVASRRGNQFVVSCPDRPPVRWLSIRALRPAGYHVEVEVTDGANAYSTEIYFNRVCTPLASHAADPGSGG